jgi:hypothetical protein
VFIKQQIIILSVKRKGNLYEKSTIFRTWCNHDIGYGGDAAAIALQIPHLF